MNEPPKVRSGDSSVCLDGEGAWSDGIVGVPKRNRLQPRLPVSLEPKDIHDATVGSSGTARDTATAEGPQQTMMPAAISAMPVAHIGTTIRFSSESIR